MAVGVAVGGREVADGVGVGGIAVAVGGMAVAVGLGMGEMGVAVGVEAATAVKVGERETGVWAGAAGLPVTGAVDRTEASLIPRHDDNRSSKLTNPMIADHATF